MKRCMLQHHMVAGWQQRRLASPNLLQLRREFRQSVDSILAYDLLDRTIHLEDDDNLFLP
jgi:hypothetical protein